MRHQATDRRKGDGSSEQSTWLIDMTFIGAMGRYLAVGGLVLTFYCMIVNDDVGRNIGLAILCVVVACDIATGVFRRVRTRKCRDEVEDNDGTD